MTEQQLEEIVRNSQREREEDHDYEDDNETRECADMLDQTDQTMGAGAKDDERFETSAKRGSGRPETADPGHQKVGSGALPPSKAGPRMMKMADYFQDAPSALSGPKADMNIKSTKMNAGNASFNTASVLNASLHENALLASGPPV